MHAVDVDTSCSEGGATGSAPRVSAILVRALIEAVAASGTPIEDCLRKAGISAQQFETPYGWVEVSELDRLIQSAVEISGDAAFGLHWSERSPMMKFDVLATATAYAPTLREALACVLRFQTLLCERAELTLIEGEGSLHLCFTPVATTELSARVRAELGISSLLRLMRHVGAPESAVLGVAFVHQAPGYASEYTRLFGERVRFGQLRTSIEIDAAWLDRRVHHANVELHQLLTTQAQDVLTRVQARAGYADQVRDYLRRALPRQPDLREAARALAMSERSLRRRLSEEGQSYSVILYESRRLRARQLLLTDPVRSIKQIAVDVGFTSGAAFFRAFKRWTGESPAAYRAARLHRPRNVLAVAAQAEC
jgi:AraC-like DNA-binding protein